MSIMNGIGAVLSKVMDWTPNKKEKRRNDIEKVKEAMDEIANLPDSPKLRNKYIRLSERLRKLERDAKNS